MSRHAHLFILVLALSACSSAAAPRPTLPSPGPAPDVVTDATFSHALRSMQRMPVANPDRAELRERVAGYLIAQADAATDADDYTAVVDAVAAVSNLYTPDEIAEGKLPPSLLPAARYLVDKGSPRGDEARVLSGLLVFKLAAPDDKKRAHDYQRLVEWGFDSRAALSGPLEPFKGLVEAWEEHHRLTPTPEVKTTLSRLFVERRNALMRLFQSAERRVPLSASVFQGVQRTALNVAAIFLRHGDTASALTHVEAMGSTGGVEERLLQLLYKSREGGMEGAGAVLDLARAYLEGGYPGVAHALCMEGLRRQAGDARFPQCLARIAATENNLNDAMAWYAEAIALVPGERALYDEILEVLNGLMEQGLFSTDPTSTRRLARRATEILEQRMQRWPDTPPPVRPEELYMAIGIAEMNAGNSKQAEARLRDSLTARESVAAMMQLALLIERTGRTAEAAELYRRALQLSAEAGGIDSRRQAEILERLGDALRLEGDGGEATRMYERGLALWDANLSRLKGPRQGMAQLRRGILLGRLARSNDAMQAFEKAMATAPELRETYATILAYLVVSQPDRDFAHRVFRHAQNQLSLEPEWKVYFALWLRAISAQTGRDAEDDVSHVLEDLSEGEHWWAKLARFGAGRISYEALLEGAADQGERTEAHFYQAVRLLAAGKQAQARQMLQMVVDTHMVNFYEFAMAQELLSKSTAAEAALSPAP